MIVDAIRQHRYLREADLREPRDTDQLAGWLEKYEVVKDYDRKEVLNPRRWQATRPQALERDNYTCLYPAEYHSKRLQIHHIEPLHAGGDPYGLWNLATLCLLCHALMHPGLAEAYASFRDGNRQAFVEFAHMEHAKKVYEPPPQAYIVRGIVIERMRNYGGREVNQGEKGRETPRRLVLNPQTGAV